jgi:predicted MFS family arabinose efflux permease
MPLLSTSSLPPVFKRLALSNISAQLSEQITLAAAPLVAVLFLGAGPAQTGYIQSAQTLPFLLLSLPAGVLVDRFSRRRLMVGAEALRAASAIGVLCFILFGSLTLPLLAAFGFMGAIGTVVYSVAAPALIPTLVRRDQYSAANRNLEVARSAAFAGGPALGGAIVGWAGAPPTYILATMLSLAAVGLLAGLPQNGTPIRVRRHLLLELKDGASFVVNHSLLRPILITAVVFNASWFILQSVYVAYAIQNLRLTAVEVGVTLSIYGAGMLVGALTAPQLTRSLSSGAMIASGPLAALIAAVIMASTIWWPSGFSAGVSFFLFGAGPILWTITTTTLRQAVSPNEMLGRISAVVLTATAGCRPIGAAVGAVIATRFGVNTCLEVAAAGFLIQFLVLFSSPVLRLRELPQFKV